MRAMWLSLGLTLAWGQDAAPGRVTVPFSDPSAPRKLVVEGLIGGVTVKGYAGKDVIIEYTTRSHPTEAERSPRPAPAGMRRLGSSTGDLNVMEMNNVVTVRRMPGRSDLTIQTPADTAVTVNALGGAIVIDGVSGEMEASNTAGAVTIANASGSVVAHSMSGNITVALTKVTPGKTMSFSTFNGNIEVTLPADTKARLKMVSQHGDIFADTDFDIKLEPEASPLATSPDGTTSVFVDKKRTRVLRLRTGTAVSGTINGGGPEMQFTTFNGRILLHKK